MYYAPPAVDNLPKPLKSRLEQAMVNQKIADLTKEVEFLKEELLNARRQKDISENPVWVTTPQSAVTFHRLDLDEAKSVRPVIGQNIKYSNEIVIKAMQLLKDGGAPSRIAATLNLAPTLIYTWAKELGIVIHPVRYKRDWDAIRQALK